MKHIQIFRGDGVTCNWSFDPALEPGRTVLQVSSDIAPDFSMVRGLPRTDYTRTVFVLPQEATIDRYLEICRQAYLQRNTVGFSYDDAGIGNLSDRTAILYDITAAHKQSFEAWYIVNYPGVKVVFA